MIPNAVTRACLWNLVVRVQGDTEFTKIKRIIDELSLRIPARTIVMRAEPDGPDNIRAWVEANWRRREGGGPASGSDEVTLWATGRAVERLPSLVRALLFSDAPTAMFWPSSLPRANVVVRELVHQADRLIVDTRKLDDERALGELCELGQREPDMAVTDLSWLGISPLHGVAALELSAGHDTWSLERTDIICVRGPDVPPRAQPARSHTDAELLASALGGRGRDPVFREALGAAVSLVGATS